jgi:hypothetical protein
LVVVGLKCFEWWWEVEEDKRRVFMLARLSSTLQERKERTESQSFINKSLNKHTFVTWLTYFGCSLAIAESKLKV